MSIAQHTLVPNASITALPLELIDALNQTYYLHLLVTDPHKVIPPGKSLLSMMTHVNLKKADQDQQDNIREKTIDLVKEAAHRAFWNDVRSVSISRVCLCLTNRLNAQAAETLSSPLPSVQLPRLKRLYNDMHEALRPIFPQNHPIIITLTSELAPTSSPLHSTINLLQEITHALRSRCAPVRDQTVDDIQMSLSHPPDLKTHSFSQPPETSSPSGITVLAQFVVDKIKAIIALAEDMKADLNTFVLGSMTEPQLRGVLLNDVKVRERNLVLTIWGGTDAVRGRWRAWVAEAQPIDALIADEKKWIIRLFRALESDQPVYCNYPSTVPLTPANNTSSEDTKELVDDVNPTTVNVLAPQLLFSTPTLLHIQNYLQAIVIAAALRLLTRLPPIPRSGSASENIESDFMMRIWSLLTTEIEDAQLGDASETGHTKLVNLADEVVRARQKSLSTLSALNPEEEKNLRGAVERTLRSTDPVFILLKKRLVSALERRLVFSNTSSSLPSSASTKTDGVTIPLKMQAGKDITEERAGKRLRLMLADSMLPNSICNSSLQPASLDHIKLERAVPGFEDKVLQEAISEVLQRLAGCIGLVEGIWGDLV